jgi:5-methylcytosine-specific restriction endonuclease McrA
MYVYCGSECRTRANVKRAGAKVLGLYYTSRNELPNRDTAQAARALRNLINYLAVRDSFRCGICRRKVDVSLKSGPSGSDRGPSVDHLIPRSQGGGDELANLRLSHWGCNRARKNRGGNEQLALVG